MTVLKRWASRGPEVAKLQTDLNALARMAYPGTGPLQLTADGIFGPTTEAWVRQFQKSAKITVDGACGPETFMAIAMHRGGAGPAPAAPRTLAQRIVYAHAQGIYDAGRTFGRHRHREADVVHLTVPSATSIPALMNTVVNTVGSDALQLFILNSHGNSRSVSIGQAIGPSNYPSFTALAPVMQRAVPKMGIEIHSCCFASARGVRPKTFSDVREGLMGVVDEVESAAFNISGGLIGNATFWKDENHEEYWTPVQEVIGAGTNAMVSIARHAGCLVKAGFNYQRGDSYGRFEDLWACARPDGTVTLHSDSVAPGAIQA